MYDQQGVLQDRREMLRVKVKSLAAEARLIRREELRTHGALRDELRQHRVGTVRRAARDALLAYGFARGCTLARMEPYHRQPGNREEVARMLLRYGGRRLTEEDWPSH